MVRSERCVDGRKSESALLHPSLEDAAEQSLAAVQGHWGIENIVHWILDIAFREDKSRIRKGNGAQNLASYDTLLSTC